jgi:hypothetical protein
VWQHGPTVIGLLEAIFHIRIWLSRKCKHKEYGPSAHPSSRRGDTAMLSPASTAALKHTPMACWKLSMSSFVAGGHT